MMTNIVPDPGFLKLIREAEGFRPRVYDDAQPDVALGPGVTIRGVLTIGYGTNLYDGITSNEAEAMLQRRAATALFTIAGIIGDAVWDQIDQPRQWALADMCYQLGGRRILEFAKMLTAVREGDWEVAANEAQNSLWYKESGDRGVRNVAILRTGVISA